MTLGPSGRPAGTNLLQLLDDAHVIVCAGTGGVGKTTTAAAMAVTAAQRGRAVAVVTIDPARRLADALGAGALTNEPHRIDGVGAQGGSLHALMLDTEATFDALIRRYADDEAHAERILQSSFYRNVAGSLSGTGDYMAMERLHELHESDRFDLLVVDTPPTRDALAFLDAPRLMSRLLDNRMYRVLVSPRGSRRGASRTVARAASSAVHLVVRNLTRVVGVDVVDDAIAFFRAFDGMERGFEQRAQNVLTMLGSDAAAFVLVASPRADTVDEARHFTGQLDAAGIAVRAIVVNRATPHFDVGADPLDESPHAQAAADFAALASREAQHIAVLQDLAPDAGLVVVPLLEHDVHDLEALGRIGMLLTGWGLAPRTR
jgi:anion-transporting  ArsA/GET3 family ATPase